VNYRDPTGTVAFLPLLGWGLAIGLATAFTPASIDDPNVNAAYAQNAFGIVSGGFGAGRIAAANALPWKQFAVASAKWGAASGAASNVGMLGISDAYSGQFSGVMAYASTAEDGAIIGGTLGFGLAGASRAVAWARTRPQIPPLRVGNSVGAALNTVDPEIVAARASGGIGKVPLGKTVAANAASERTLSGWTDRSGYLASSSLTDDVLANAKAIRYEFKPQKLFDQGVPGRFNASHAEPQMSMVSDTFGVSKVMCTSCRSYMSSRAVAEARTFTIADPTRIWTFAPNSTSWTPR